MKKMNLESLRAAADAAVASWRDARAVAERTREAHAEAGRGVDRHAPSTEQLRVEEAYLHWLECNLAADVAGHAADAALEAFDVAQRDETAISRSPRAVHAELDALRDERRKIVEALADVDRRVGERVQQALAADRQYAAARAAAGLPPAAPLPPYTPMTPAGAPTFFDRLAALARDGAPVPNGDEQIAAARHSIVVLAARAETEAREVDERERAAREKEEARAIAHQAVAKRAQESAEIRAADHAASVQGLEDLAGAFFRRRMGT